MKTTELTRLVAGLCLLVGQALLAAPPFDSGSDGSYGPLNVTANTVLELPPDGTFRCTTIDVAPNVTLSFKRNALNTPVYLLATGDVNILGVTDVSGKVAIGELGGEGGPGGSDGGTPANGQDQAPGDGLKPGGGKGSDACPGAGGYGGKRRPEFNACHNGNEGNTYGNSLIVPQTQLTVGNASGSPGSVVSVNQSLTSDKNVLAMQYDLNYDASKLSPAYFTQDSRLAGHVVRFSDPSSGSRRVLIYSLTRTPVANGPLAEQALAIVPSAPAGDSTVSISNAVLIGEQRTRIEPVQVANGTVTITTGYEADVAPRPNGNNNGAVTILDWIQVGRFAAGLDTADSGSEFQRADSAPRISNGNLVLGNGAISILDWIQAGRYAAGLDPVTPAGGPSSPCCRHSVCAVR